MQNFLGEVNVFLSAACFSQNFPKVILDQKNCDFNGPVIIGTVPSFMQCLFTSEIVEVQCL